MNHPQMSILMSNQDEDMLHFMTNLKVRQGTLIIVDGRLLGGDMVYP